MKTIAVTAFCLSIFFTSTQSIAGGCESKLRSTQAYTSVLNFDFLFVDVQNTPKYVAQAKSQAELNEQMEALERDLKLVERIEKSFVGCLSEQENRFLIKHMAKKELEVEAKRNGTEYMGRYIEWLESASTTTPINNLGSAQDMVDMAYAKIEEAQALSSTVEANIKLAAEKRRQEIAETQRKSEIAQSKLEQEQQQIAELEASLQRERMLQRQLEAAETKRRQLEAERDQYQDSRNNANQSSSSTPTTSVRANSSTGQSGDGYIKKQGVFCLSKGAFDRQIEFLSRGQLQYANGCYSTPTQQNVWLRDTSWNGECVLERISDERQLWTFCEDYESW